MWQQPLHPFTLSHPSQHSQSKIHGLNLSLEINHVRTSSGKLQVNIKHDTLQPINNNPVPFRYMGIDNVVSSDPKISEL